MSVGSSGCSGFVVDETVRAMFVTLSRECFFIKMNFKKQETVTYHSKIL